MRTSKETIDFILKVAEEQGLNRRELADKVGVSESAISRYANYSREFPINEIDKYAEALGLHVYEILDLPMKINDPFPSAESVVNSLFEIGALNRETVESKKFQDRLFQAMLKDLRELTKE